MNNIENRVFEILTREKTDGSKLYFTLQEKQIISQAVRLAYVFALSDFREALKANLFDLEYNLIQNSL